MAKERLYRALFIKDDSATEGYRQLTHSPKIPMIARTNGGHFDTTDGKLSLSSDILDQLQDGEDAKDWVDAFPFTSVDPNVFTISSTGVLSTPSMFLDHEDLDNFVRTGFFFCTLCDHAPFEKAHGTLVSITNGSTEGTQFFTVIYCDDSAYTNTNWSRVRNNNTWSDWKRV